jgi:hypothetical protein
VEVPQKTKNRMAIQSSNTAPRNIPKGGYMKGTCTSMFIEALLTIAKP